MGLDTTHNCWHGPYSYFNSFRKWVAEQIGMDLRKMEGFNDSDYPSKSWDGYDHPIIPLLNHSDCDGELSVEECKSIVKGSRMILDDISSDNWGDFESLLLKFAEGCLLAIKENEPVKFQ